MVARPLGPAVLLVAFLVSISSAAADNSQVMRFVSTGEGQVAGHRAVVVRLQSVANGAPVQLFLPNTQQNSPNPTPKSELMDKVRDLTPGQIVRVEAEKMNGGAALRYLDIVKVQPGEENPRGFVFSETYQDRNSKQQVVKLTKYGQVIEAVVPSHKDKRDMVPDEALMADVGKLKEGDVVYAEVAPSRPPQLVSIFPYQAPKPGKLQKIEEQEVDGQKKMTAVIDAEGKSINAVVPGKLVNKRWQPNVTIQKLLRAVRPGSEVEFAAYDDDGKTFLIDIHKTTPPKPERPERASARERSSK